MKKLLAAILALSAIAASSMTVFAQERIPYIPNFPSNLVSPRLGYDGADRTFRVGGKWTSYQYYCNEGDSFGGYIKNLSPEDGELTITIYYASSVGGSRTEVESGTVTGGGWDGVYITADTAGYYNVVFKNTGSKTVTSKCGVERD